jgi:hypothetical protein
MAMAQDSARGTRNGQESQEKKVKPTAGEVFRDGSMLELVRDSADPRRPALLRFHGKQTIIAREIEHEHARYVPVDIDSILCRQLRLPARSMPYGSTLELFNQIYGLITRYSDLSDDAARLVTFFVFSTFFCDCLQLAPCLLLHGERSAAVGLLRILSWVCRHPLLLVNPRLGSEPEHLDFTSLIYLSEPEAKIEKLLTLSQLSRFGVFRNGSLHEICGAKAIYVRSPSLRSPSADECLRISIAPARELLKSVDEMQERPIREELQAKMLNYRLMNYGKVKSSNFDVLKFTGATRALARSLGACIVDASDLQARVAALLQNQDEAVRAERAAEIESILLEALLVLCHERRTSVHVGQVARIANAILSRRGESLILSPRETGSKLKGLGFRTTRLDAGGRGLYLLGEIRKQVHKLARLYTVPSLQSGLPGCPDCKETSG